MSMEPESSGFSIDAAFKIGLDLSSKMEKLISTNEQIWKRLQRNTPQLARFAVSLTITNTAQQTVTLSGPDSGYYWLVESIAVGGNDQNVTAAGSAAIYVVGSNVLVSPGMGNLVDQAKTLPNTAFYGSRDIVINDGEYLLGTIFGGTSGQTYVFNISASVYPTDFGSGRSIVNAF